jgi:hypothetical protein
MGLCILFMRFKKKPIIIEATQWFQNGDHPHDDVWRPYEDSGMLPVTPREGIIVRYFRKPNISGEQYCVTCNKIMHYHGWIDTLEGGHIVCPGDWIITGIQNEYYPCKSYIFEQTYEKIED